MGYITEQNIFIFLVQLFLILALARSLGELFRRWKQPPLTAEILVGILLGPTIFGHFFPSLYQSVFPSDIIQKNMLETVAWLGVLFLLLEIGLEIDFLSAWRQKGDVLKIAVSDIVIPMAISFTLSLYLPDNYLVNPEKRLAFALFMAVVMTISAMPVAARALHDLKLSKTDLGFLIMSALSVNDIIGWFVFTLVLSLFTQLASGFANLIVVLVMTVGFIIICLTIGRRFSNFAVSKIKEKQMPEPGTSLTFICLLGLMCGAITQKIGIQALFGFFIAGIMAGSAKALPEKTRQVISQMVYAVFVPIFFASIGLKMDFLAYFDPVIVLFVAIIGISVRFLGAWIGVSLCRIPKTNRLTIAIAHTPGGMMEIIMGLLALEFKLITPTVFTGIVFGALITAIVMGPWLAWGLGRRKQVSVFPVVAEQHQ